MFKVAIKPQWTIREGDRDVLVPRLLGLLVAIAEHGNLSVACRASEASYRYAWGLLHQGELLFGAPLVTSGRGKQSKLTALGDKLVWADRRISARLSPLLDSLASELEAEIEELRAAAPAQSLTHRRAIGAGKEPLYPPIYRRAGTFAYLSRSRSN